jgi:electron transport complex protein RnfC
MAVSFPGGIKIKDCKHLTSGAASITLPPCSEHIFPLAQHNGTPIEPIVKIGEKVKVGQKLADASDYLAVPIHSSVSGRVVDIRNVLTPQNKNSEAIVIENDRQYTPVYSNEEIPTPEIYTTRELLWLIRDAGIIEPDGTPVHAKLSPHKSVKFVIANCAESDSYVTSKHRRIVENPEEIINGLKIAMRILNLKDGYIGVEENIHGAVNLFKRLIRYDESIHILKLKSKYPQSDETQIIKAVTGRDIPSDSIVLDACTLYQISQAINYGKSVTSNIVTVSGDMVKRPINFIAPLGVPISFLFKKAGGLEDESAKIIVGGGIRGTELSDINAPIIKTTTAVLALSNSDEPMSSKKCGLCRKCIRKCPMRINPKLLSNISNPLKAYENFVSDCTECNLCSYICKKNREPMQKIIELKKQVEEYKQ